MKLTKTKLKQIIREELNKVLSEGIEGSVLMNPNATDEEIIAYMNERETEEEAIAAGRGTNYAGHVTPHMKHDFYEKERWFKSEGWKRLNANIWLAGSHGGYSDPPMGVDEDEFAKVLQSNFDRGRPQTFEEAEEIFNQTYDNMEEHEAGFDI